MIVTSDQLYTADFTNKQYFILQETWTDQVTYRVCWAARLTSGKIVNPWDWCYLSGEYLKPEAARRRLPTLRARNEKQQESAYAS